MLGKPISRSELLARGAKGGAALLVGGSALGQFVRRGRRGSRCPRRISRTRACSSAPSCSPRTSTRRRSLPRTRAAAVTEVPQARLRQRAGALPVGRRRSSAARARRPPSSGDIDFSYPAGTFAARSRSSKFAQQLEATMLGDLPRRDRRDPDEQPQDRPRPDRRLRGAALRVLHDGDGRQDIQPLVPAAAHDRPGVERARRVHGIGGDATRLGRKGLPCGSLASSRAARRAALCAARRRVGQLEPRDGAASPSSRARR